MPFIWSIFDFFLFFRFDDTGRCSCSRSKDESGTESTGLTEYYSPSVDDISSGPGSTAGDTPGRSSADAPIALYSELAKQRRDFRLGRPRPRSCSGDRFRFGNISEACNRLYTPIEHFFDSSSADVQESTVSHKIPLDWPFSKPAGVDDWSAVLSLAWYMSRIHNVFG